MSFPSYVKTLLFAVAAVAAAGQTPVKVSEGTVTLSTYEPSGREMQPPLFGTSSVSGMYPFTTYQLPYQEGGPKPKVYQAIFVENEYLKLTYVPEFGGRIFSLWDKVRGREVFYRNDVIKPSHYNPRISWTMSGIEMTGPHDLHMLTLHGEPYWSNKIVRHPDGSVSLVLGELDPVYHMKVNLSARLYPGIAAMQMGVFCYNRRDGRMPQMFWLSAAIAATEKLHFIYPMTRTIGHTTSEIADWPVYNGVDYSVDRNNKHMLGVFGIDIYDNFQGAYKFDEDYGIFRYADRRLVTGMKMWTFGYGPGSKNIERGYTDNAGPYVEVQSGRHVWDGHYEWVAPHKVENWNEWWVPVSGIGGLTTITKDVALNLEAKGGSVKVALSAVRPIPGAKVTVKFDGGEIFSAAADLAPGKPWSKSATAQGSVAGLRVRVTDASGHELMNYLRPDENPGRKDYTPFTKPLEKPATPPEKMSVEELVLAAEFKLKELNYTSALDLVNQALAKDPGYSRAHLLLGIYHYNAGRYAKAASELEKVIGRDPYQDEAYYYLAMSQFGAGEDAKAERNLYYIWPLSAYYGEREYQLGRLAYRKKDYEGARGHLERAVVANGWDLNARLLLALSDRDQGRKADALAQLAEIEKIDPTDRPSLAERYYLGGDQKAWAEMLRLMGGQSQEALDVSQFYRQFGKWNEAAEVLRTVERNNKDPWGTPPEFYYTLAYCMEKKGDAASAAGYRKKAHTVAKNIDRWPYREESEQVFAAALKADPKDALAHYNLGLLLYYRERPAEAIREFEAAVDAAPADFSSRRALGMALAEQGRTTEAAAQLEKAVSLDSTHVRTRNDLSSLYARVGKFDEQLEVLQKALARSPNDDNLAEGVLAAHLAMGRYDEADKLIATHKFAPRHRSYGLRDKYRYMRFGMGAVAFKKSDYAGALKMWESAMKPPVSLGVDDFVSQTSPRAEYYIGRALEAEGKGGEAKAAYEKAIAGVDQLTGDRDSWNSENFHMVLALERLGRKEEAAKLVPHFEGFAQTEMDSKNPAHQAEARYLMALVKKHAGDQAAARKLIEEAVKIQPDMLPARLELRGDVADPLGK